MHTRCIQLLSNTASLATRLRRTQPGVLTGTCAGSANTAAHLHMWPAAAAVLVTVGCCTVQLLLLSPAGTTHMDSAVRCSWWLQQVLLIVRLAAAMHVCVPQAS